MQEPQDVFQTSVWTDICSNAFIIKISCKNYKIDKVTQHFLMIGKKHHDSVKIEGKEP